MNLPNKLTLARIILVPLMMVAFMVEFPYHIFVALGLYIIAATTDFLDGYIARKYNLVTDMGKFLDPIADKLLATTALILIAGYNLIPNPFGLICLFLFVARDTIISALRQIAATKNVVIAADKWGKYKTFILDIAIPVIFLFGALSSLNINAIVLDVIKWLGYGLMIIASLLNLISAVNYLIKNRKVFKENKE